ncbi:MAG: glycosyltransferase family 2 protein [Flavobacteriaceae bacterium]
MQNKPYFSVVLPNYNHGKFLKQAIDSVLNQSYNNWELLIIDNHSSDNSDKIISSYDDPRIKSFKIKNDGVIAKSRNYGIKNSKADWIAFLDSDDIWYENKLSTLINLTYKGFDIICSNEYQNKIYESKKTPNYYNLETKKFYDELLIFGNKLSTSSTIVSNSFLKKKKLLFNESKDLITVEDYDLWLNIALKNGNFGFCEDFLGEYRIHGKNLSENFDYHFKNLKNLTMLHVFEIQNFSNSQDLWEIIEPRLKIIRISYYLRKNIYRGLSLLVREMFSLKASKSISLLKFLIKKLFRR